MSTERIEIEITGKADGAVAAARETEKALEKVIAQTKAAGGSTEDLDKQLLALREQNAQTWTAEYAKQLQAVIQEQQLAGKGAGDLQARLDALNQSKLGDDSGIKVLSRGDVARALGETGSAADRAGGNLRGFSQAGGAATQIIAGLERASKGGIDAIFGMVAATRAAITAFLSATGPVGVLLASVGLLVGAFVALKDVLFPVKEQIDDTGKKAEEAAEHITLTKKAVDDAASAASRAAAGGIRELADAYDTLAQRADAALQAQRALARAEAGRDDAALEKTLAEIDLLEKKGEITAPDAAGRRFGARQESETRSFDREQQEAQRQIAREQKTIADAQQRRGELDDSDRRAQRDLERAKNADRQAQLDRNRLEEERRQQQEAADARVAAAEKALDRDQRSSRADFVRTRSDIDRSAGVAAEVEAAKKEQADTRARFAGPLGDRDFVEQIRREEEQKRITPEEAARARSSQRARGSVGIAEDRAAAGLAAAQARAGEIAKARAEETAAIDETIVATRDRIALLQRERDLAREAFDLRRQAGDLGRQGERITEQKKAEEQARKDAVDTAGRSLGADVRRGLGGITPAPGSENAALVRGVNRAAEALGDGTTAGELGALSTAVDRLGDAAEKQGSNLAGHIRRMQIAVDARIARLEQQISRINDTR